MAMTATTAKAYRSPSLVLLAFDWPDGESRNDFLGFAIRRAPGFLDLATGNRPASDWLPNRISFGGPPAAGQPDFPSNVAPIQKFMWWDARLEGIDPGQPLTYEVSAVCGPSNAPRVEPGTMTSLQVALPDHVEGGIGTWFNRAVMSSQAFSRKVRALGLRPGQPPTQAQELDLRSWLANGMEKPVPDFIAAAQDSLVGAIYHLNDSLWIVPALKHQMTKADIGLVYDSVKHKKNGQTLPNESQSAIDALPSVRFFGRDHTNIMHNKFLVRGTKLLDGSGSKPEALTCGSANYTTSGLTSQANLIHTFQSGPLAELYWQRWALLKGNPARKKTKEGAGWSNTVSVGDARIRVFFSPEPGNPGDPSISMETIVQAVDGAQSSVIFCLFMPTDQALLDACFSVGDAGKMMFGLVNRIPDDPPALHRTSTGKIPADEIAALEIYHRSQKDMDTIDARHFNASDLPGGFELEMNVFPGTNPPPYPPVIIHHKFVVIDAETVSPTIYTGSANMSGNAIFGNDENLLEIKGSARLSQIYLAEFLRLYEHYRARAAYFRWKESGGAPATFSLQPNRSWADRHYAAGSPEYKARLHMLGLT